MPLSAAIVKVMKVAIVMQLFIIFAILYNVTASISARIGSLDHQYAVEENIATIKLRRFDHFHFAINCTPFTGLLPIDAATGIAVKWLNINNDGKIAFGYADNHVKRIHRICFRYAFYVCKCLRVIVEEVLPRQRRDVGDVEYSVECGASTAVTEGVFLFNVDYHGLSIEQKNEIVTKTASYVNIQRRNILVLDNHGSFYKTGLVNPKFISFGLGDTTATSTNTTVVKFLASCGALSSTDSRITKIQAESPSGQLSSFYGHSLISWYFITGTFVPLTTTSLPGTTTPAGPQPPTVKGPINIIVSNSSFILEYTIPEDTFHDKEDGGTSKLSLYLYQSNGVELSKSSWIMLLSRNMIFLYSAKTLYETQPKDGYKYRLSAIDSSGREAHTDLNVQFSGPLYVPNYIRTMEVTSSSSVIVTSYYDVYILDLLHYKMSPYLNIARADFFNLEFNATRGFRILSIKYTFSSRDLVETCNISAINNLKSKLDGKAAEDAFRAALQPQFELTSIGVGTFASSCSHLSNGLPIVGVSIGSVKIIAGKYFSFNISSSAFGTPPGSNMRLSLELRFDNNSGIPVNFWIGLSSSYLDQGASLHGIITSKMAELNSITSLKVVAITPLLAEISQTVQLTMQTTTSNVLFYVVMIQSSTSFVSLTSFVNPFVSFMSSFLGISRSFFSIIDYTVSSSTVVTWTILTLSSQPCQTSQIQAVKDKLLDINGNINDNLKTGLINNANFNPSKVEVNLAGSCDLPSVGIQIPKLSVPKYDSLTYEVPANAFRDQSDSTLSIQLLVHDGSPLPETSWIWYDKIARRISGFPFSITNGTYDYTLRATDSDGQFVDQNISIALSWTQPSYNFFYQVQFSYDSSLLPYSNVITKFIQTTKLYFNQPNAKDLIIFRPLFLAKNKISLYLQNTSLSSERCDVAGNSYILSMMRDSTNPTKPSQKFIRYMQPNFTIEHVEAGESPSCSAANRKPPYFNSGDSSIVGYYSTTKSVPYCDVSMFLLPANTFIDEEEGNTRSLKLILKSEDDKTLPVSNWVALNTTSQTIYAVATDNVFYQSSKHQYKLVATDLDGKSSSTLIKFNVIGPPPAGYYNITMALSISMIQDEPYVFQINSLFNSLKQVFIDGPSLHIRSYNVERTSNGSFLATLILSPCHMTENVCNTTAINELRSKLFSPGTSEMNPSLNSVVDRRFRVIDVKESRSGPCSKDPPYLRFAIPNLSVSFCRPFSYQIPVNTFADKQDGDTRMLKLQLLQYDGNAIPSSSWLQFDSDKQQVTAVLTIDQNTTGFQRDHTFILVATDSDNLSVNATVRVTLSGFLPPYSHTFTMETVYSIAASGHLLYIFAEKLTGFLGGNLEITSKTEASGNNLIVSWTNCSLRYEPCDVLGIKEMRDRMQTSDGVVKENFKKAMEPEFTKIFIKETKFPVCQQDVPPVVAVPFGPITVTTCSTYRVKIPKETFTDTEQGDTRNLELRMKANPYYWIQFDAKQQEIRILLTTEIAKSIASVFVSITITATDLFQHVTEQQVNVNIDRSRLSPNHKVSMQFMIRSLVGTRDYINVYDELRNSIVRYLLGNAVITSLEYDRLPAQVILNKSLQAEWSSCSLAQDSCQTAEISRLSSLISNNNLPNSAFKQALLPNFEVLSANTTKQALCADQLSSPVVQNPLPIIDIAFCGYKVYQIPANTFYDKIDGNTRNLTLSVLNGSDQVAKEPWFDFDTAQQTFRILLADSLFTNLAIPATFTYKLRATTNRGTSVQDKLQFRIAHPHQNVSYALKINFLWQQVNPPSKIAVLITVMDRIATYMGRGPDDIHFVSKTSSNIGIGEYFVINIANCSARYDPCDRDALELYKQRVIDQTGVLEPFRKAMGAEISSIYVQVRTFGPCNVLNSAPRVKNPLTRLVVPSCSDFNYTIPASSFFDEEQVNLHLSLTKINGVPVSGSYQWVNIYSPSSLLYGIVSDTVLINKPSNGYNLTIRATDNGKLFAETHLILEITGTMPQKFYQFTMSVRPRITILSAFEHQVLIIRLLNSYFKTRFAHLINAVSNSGILTARYSICPLPKRCDESLAYSYFSKIVTSDNKVPTELASYFAMEYSITATSVFRNPLCKTAINPPEPSRLTWEVTASYCGGFRLVVPADMFSDREDGNTRNLKLSLHMNATHPVSSHYWVQLNQTNQELYGFPTRQISLTSPSILLVAKDSTGQEASVTVKFVFTVHPEPKYIYKIVYQKISVEAFIDDVVMFASKIQAFLSDSQNTSFGLIRHSHSSDNAYYIDYANCSVTYDPCDTHALTTVKDRLLTSDSLPTNAFKSAMHPITISYGRIELLEPCLGTLTHPPVVSSRIKVLNIPMWSIFNYQIQVNTFYDTEDGDTRKLALALADGENNAISTNSWLQLNSTTQKITAFGYASLALTQPPSGYSFVLTATDSSKLSAADSFYAKIYGPAQLLKDCQIQIRLSTTSNSKTNNELATSVIQTMASYFTVKTENIGLVEIIRHSGSQFTFSWSYVSDDYHKMSPSSSFGNMQVDYKGLANNILAKLFQDDHKTVRPSFYAAFLPMSIISVKTAFSGLCQNIPPVTMTVTSLSISVPFAGYRIEAIQRGWFYDYEDGNAFNLNLHLLSSNNATLSIESWANIDTQSKTLLFSLRDTQRYSSQNNFIYYLTATDSGGKTAVLPVSVTRIGSTTTLSPFKITFEFTVSSFEVTEIFVNQSIFMSEKIAQLYSLGSGMSIVTKQFSARYGPSTSRSITWQPSSYQGCDSSSVLTKTREVLQPSSALLTEFKLPFMPRFNLLRVYYSTSCGVPGMAPSQSAAVLEFNITMCSPFVYKLPANTFVDSVDGEMSSMRMRLLGKDKGELASNSWMLLEPASLQLYAIFQSSMHQAVTSSVPSSSMTSSPIASLNGGSQSFEFNLEATNSRGLKSYKGLKVNVLDYPYTSDCYATMNVKRTFGPSQMASLDVLYKLINSISNYYSDQTTKIKVYKFVQSSALSYKLIFSNCSFVFDNMKRAKQGLDESYRTAITSIFSRMVKEDGTFQSTFKSSLHSSGFKLQNITVSYSCIEAPPYSRFTQRIRYAFFTLAFNDVLPYDIFTDGRDGHKLTLSLHYVNGTVVSADEWLQINQWTRTIYGSVTIMQQFGTSYRYLLVATDSSFRTVNISYIVRIGNSPPVQYVRFYLSFSSIFSRFSTTAYVLRNFTLKIAKYIDNNNDGSNIIIYTYRSFTGISWVYTKLNCDSSSMNAIMQKLQKNAFRPEPSDALKAALGPEFTVQSILVNGPKCISSTNVQVIVNYQINLNSSLCGYMKYNIPNNVYSSSNGDTTKDLLLTLQTSTGGTISADSVVQFSQDSQYVLLVPVYSTLSQSLTYRLNAESPRSSQSTASTNIRINFQGYEELNAFENKLCTLTVNVTTRYNPSVLETEILQAFIDKLANYLGTSYQQIQIMSYTRYWGFPIKFTIQFSQCSWIELIKDSASSASYLQQVTTITSKLFAMGDASMKSAKTEFIESLKPEFNVEGIERNETSCSGPPNRPPIGKTIELITAPRCGEFKYKLPEDLFSDEDGNTRNLKTQLLQKDGAELPTDSWLVYDNSTQMISGMQSDKALAEQPQEGYQYRILATDKHGSASYLLIIIKTDGGPYTSSNGMGINLSYKSAIERRYTTDVMLAFTRRLSSYKMINDPHNRFRIKSASIIGSNVTLSLLNCTPCSNDAILKYYEVLRTQSELQTHMAPEFPMAYSVEASGSCGPGDDSYNNITSGTTHNVTFCRKNKINFLTLNGISELPADIKFIVRQQRMTSLAQNSWFWFNESSSDLEAFPSENVWKNQQETGTPYLWSTARISTNARIGSFFENKLRIIDTPPSSGLQFTMNLKLTLAASHVDAYYISLIFDPLTKYLGREDLQHISFNRNSGNSFTWRFRICGLPQRCTDAKVISLNNKIYSDPGKLKTEFKAVFLSGITIASMNNSCNNYPPEILTPNLNLTIPVCGLYRYQIPRDFAKDAEDGDAKSLAFSMRMPNGDIISRNSWIQFNETSREIYAFPTETVSTTPRSSGWDFLLIVRDNDGGQASTSLRIFVEQDRNTFYSLNFTFQTVNQDSKTSFLDIQVQFLSKLSSFFFNSSLSQYRVLSFEKMSTSSSSSETFTIRFGNCSVTKYLCKKENTEIISLQDRITSSSKNENSLFNRFTSNEFRITSVKNESRYSVDKTPLVLNNIGVIRVGMCDQFVSEIPKSVFYDAEGIEGYNLTTNFTFVNNSKVPDDYWLQIFNNYIYAVPYGDIKDGTHELKLIATDRCGQSTSTVVTVVLVNEPRPAGIEFHTILSVKNTQERPAVYYISKVKGSINAGMMGSVHRSKISYFKQIGDVINVKWLNCSDNCDKNSTRQIKENVYSSSIFKDAFLPNFNLTSISDNETVNCLKQLVYTHNITLKVGLCQKLNFTIPKETLFANDGEKLNLQLLDESKEAVSKEDWLQFDAEKQAIYGYPRTLKKLDIKRTYKYFLLASDQKGNTVYTNLSVEIIGDVPNVTQEFTIVGETKMSPDAPLVTQEIDLINKIGLFFENFEVNNILYIRDSERVNFTWGFCNTASDICDCEQIRSVREKLKSFEAFKQYMQPEVDIKSNVIENMTGVCAKQQVPKIFEDRIEVIVTPGQYFSSEIRSTKFYDYEDGHTGNLTLYLANKDDLRYDDYWWMKIQDYQICGLATLYESTRMVSRRAVYKTIAEDRCGNEITDSYNVTVLHIIPKLTYKVIVYLNDSFGKNCTETKILTQKISNYIGIPEEKIYIANYTNYNGTYNSSVVTWGVTNITEKNCTNGTMRELTDKILFENGTVNNLFVEALKPEYKVIKANDDDSHLCLLAPIVLPQTLPDDDTFPWWLIILLIILIILLFLLWCIWIIIPRCCWGCCIRKLACCKACCVPGGKYASLEDPLIEADALAQPREEEIATIGNEEKPGIDLQIANSPDEITEDKIDVALLPEDSPIDPEILNSLPYHGGSEPEDSGLEGMPLNKETSSGFSEEFSGEEEMILRPETVQLAEAAPMALPEVQRNLPPPLYPFGETFDIENQSVTVFERDMQDSYSQFNVLDDGTERVDQAPVPNQDQEFRRLPDPNIQYSSLRRPSQVIEVTRETYNPETEVNETRIVDSRVFGTSSDNISSDFQHKRERRSSLVSTLIPERKYGSVRRYSVSAINSNRNLDFLDDERFQRRRSLTSVVNRRFDNDDDEPYAIRRRSMSRRSLSEGSILSEYEPEPYSYSRRASRESLATDGGNGRRMSRRISRSFFVTDQEGNNRQIVSFADHDRDGPAPRSSRRESTSEQFFLVTGSQYPGREGDSSDISLAPVSFGVEGDGIKEPSSQRRVVEDIFAKNDRSRRNSLQVIDSRLVQDGRRRRSIGSGSRKVSDVFISDRFNESDSGISDFGFNPTYRMDRENLPVDTAKTRSSRQVTVQPKRRRRSRAKPPRSNTSRDIQLEVQPRRISRVYVNDAYMSDSVV